MPLIDADAPVLSNDYLLPGYFEDQRFRMQHLCKLRFRGVPGDQVRVATTGPLPRATILDDLATIADTTVRPNPAPRTFRFAVLAHQFSINLRVGQTRSSNVNVQSVIQADKGRKVLWYEYSRLVDAGDATVTGQFDGLDRIIADTRRLDVAGGPLTYDVIHRAKQLLQGEDGWGDPAWVTSSLGDRAIAQLEQASGNTTFREMAYLKPDGRSAVKLTRYLDGWPVLVNDLQRVFPESSDEPVAPEDAITGQGRRTDIYLVDFAEVWGIFPSPDVTTSPTATPPITMRAQTPVGIDSSSGTTVYLMTMTAGLCSRTQCGQAMIKNVSTPSESAG